MSGYTKIDNWLFDEVMPRAKGNAFKVIMTIARLTNGWGKDSDMISLSQFQEMTGVVGRSNMIKAIQSAIDGGFIVRQKCGLSYIYKLSASHETGLDQSRNMTSSSHETVPLGSHETGHTKEKDKDTINKVEWESVLSLLDYFSELTHVRQPKLTTEGWAPHKEKWIDPVMDLLNVCEYNDETIRCKMNGAVDLMREKGLTIASPKSIYNVALSINGNRAETVTRTDDGGVYV